MNNFTSIGTGTQRRCSRRLQFGKPHLRHWWRGNLPLVADGTFTLTIILVVRSTIFRIIVGIAVIRFGLCVGLAIAAPLHRGILSHKHNHNISKQWIIRNYQIDMFSARIHIPQRHSVTVAPALWSWLPSATPSSTVLKDPLAAAAIHWQAMTMCRPTANDATTLTIARLSIGSSGRCSNRQTATWNETSGREKLQQKSFNVHTILIDSILQL